MAYRTPDGQVYPLFRNMTEQNHLLVAGTTGSGKSVAINGIIATLLYRFPFDAPNGAQLILVDPKKVELAAYANIPHTICHADGFNPEKWREALSTAVEIMDKRYAKMKRKRLKEYDGGDLYVIIDEWASIYKNGGASCYRAVLRLVSEGRAARVHVIMATQIPKASIIPTEVRENFGARLCLRTNNRIQSRVIMEENGCEDFPNPKTVGYALGYYCLPCEKTLWKIPYVMQDELDRLVAHWERQNTFWGRLVMNGI